MCILAAHVCETPRASLGDLVEERIEEALRMACCSVRSLLALQIRMSIR